MNRPTYNRAQAARELVNNPLWPDLVELVRQEIAAEWLRAESDEARNICAIQRAGVEFAARALRRLAGSEKIRRKG